MRLTTPPALAAYYRRLTARERALVLITGGAVLFIANLVLLSVLLRSARELGGAYAEKSQQLSGEQLFANQKNALWAPRNDWLKKTQPVLTNYNIQGNQLLETINGVARSNQMVVTSPGVRPPPARTPGDAGAGPTDYQAVTVSVETQSDWKSVVRFVAAVQQPDAFLVFDSANLRTEQNDPARMRGTFVISKWFAPAGK